MATISPAGSPAGSRVGFSALAGWNDDTHSQALGAFRRSCARILRLGPATPLDPRLDPGSEQGALYGRAGDWHEVCAAADHVAPGDGAARRFFETRFAPVTIGTAAGRGLFTGYYEPEMKGSLHRHGPFQTPVLGPPPGFVEARRRGEIGPTRAAIEAGALDADKLALVWLEDPIDAFFLHVQGSGRVRLEDGSVVRLAFAAKNGRPYTSIGAVLIERGELTREEVTMQTIRAWANAHPAERRALFQRNESYIFFKRLDKVDPKLGPPGAEEVNLTPGRSLAVDRRYHPLGTLLWLETAEPLGDGSGARPLRRLMVAQDTGSAIKGAQRGDIFWGAGDAAGNIAGRMKEAGRLVALVPLHLAPASP